MPIIVNSNGLIVCGSGTDSVSIAKSRSKNLNIDSFTPCTFLFLINKQLNIVITGSNIKIAQLIITQIKGI